jgi:hypothetical protein
MPYEIFEEREERYIDVENQELFYFKGDEEKTIRIKNDDGFHVIHNIKSEWIDEEVRYSDVVEDTWRDGGNNRTCIVIRLKWDNNDANL